MAQTPDPANVILGRALKRARKAAGFSNAHLLLAAVKKAEGSAPSYSSYAQWESGEVGPRDGSLDVIQRFHESRGTWVSVEVPDLATALLALTAELTAWRTERQELREQVADLEAQVAELVADHDGSGSSAPAVPEAPRRTKG